MSMPTEPRGPEMVPPNPSGQPVSPNPAYPQNPAYPPGQPYQPNPSYPPAPVYPGAPQSPPDLSVEAPVERVGRGLAFSLVAIPAGVVATVMLWKLGFIASLIPFLLAGLAVWLYARGAGTQARRGAPALIGVILVGVAASLVSIVATDIWTAYPEYGAASGMSRAEFVLVNLLRPDLWGAYLADLVIFLLFAALGVIGTVIRLAKAPAASA